MTLRVIATLRFLDVSTEQNLNLPSYLGLSASSWYLGINAMQGPHLGPQKSITTGNSLLRNSASRFSLLISTTANVIHRYRKLTKSFGSYVSFLVHCIRVRWWDSLITFSIMLQRLQLPANVPVHKLLLIDGLTFYRRNLMLGSR